MTKALTTLAFTALMGLTFWPQPAAAQWTTQSSLQNVQAAPCKAPTCVYRFTCRCDTFHQW